MIESTIVNEWMAEAVVKARREDIQKLLEAKFGPVPAEVQEKIDATDALILLQQWLLAAGKAGSLDDFRRDVGF